MTITQMRQMAKGKAFNSILRIYHPKSNYKHDEFNRDETYGEQRDQNVRYIIECYLKELDRINRIKNKPKQSA